MSWLIQTILNNKTSIKENHDVNSDEYNDLIFIEKAIKDLHEKGVLTDDDLTVIEFFGEGNIPSDTAKELNKYRSSVVQHYIYLCERLAFFMGGYFTNDGYIDYMVNKYNLSFDQEISLRNFIKSKYRHKIMRNSYNGK